MKKSFLKSTALPQVAFWMLMVRGVTCVVLFCGGFLGLLMGHIVDGIVNLVVALAICPAWDKHQ